MDGYKPNGLDVRDEESTAVTGHPLPVDPLYLPRYVLT
jgi:hypothetical protein